MKKTFTSLLVLSLLLIIPNTIYTVERKSCKTIVADYLNDGGKMILHVEDETKELNLLEHFQDLSKLYRGEMTEDIKTFSNTSTWKWLTMSQADYAHRVTKFFIYKHKMFNSLGVSNSSNLSREFLSKFNEYLSCKPIEKLCKLYILNFDKKLQKNHPMGYLPILLLKGSALFNCYQADVIALDTMQGFILIAISLGELLYVASPAIVWRDLMEVNDLQFFMDFFNFFLMCYFSSSQITSLLSFAPGMISTIGLSMKFYQCKERYNRCEQKINNMKMQNAKCNEVIEDLQETITLLEEHKKVAVLCSEGTFFNEGQGFDATTALNSDIGSIVAEYIDPSIKSDKVVPDVSTEQGESNYNCFQKRYCQALTITAATSAVLIPFAGFILQQYFPT